MPTRRKDKWKFYQKGRKGNEMWYWRRVASNGNIVGHSTEGYKRFADCQANATRNGYVKEAKPQNEKSSD